MPTSRQHKAASQSAPGGPIVDRECDAALFESLREGMPATVELREMDCGAEDPAFVEAAVRTLIELIER